jgi:hypothetical protein
MLAECMSVHHLETPEGPRAIITGDITRMRKCEMLGVFESVGETEEQARSTLQIHVRELGATHVLLMSARPINVQRSFNEAIRNETSSSPLYKNVVAQGKGFKCK